MVEAPNPCTGTASPEGCISPVITSFGLGEICCRKRWPRRGDAAVNNGIQLKAAWQIPIGITTKFPGIERLDVRLGITRTTRAHPPIYFAGPTAIGGLIRVVPAVCVVYVMQSRFGCFDFPYQARLVIQHTCPRFCCVVLAVIHAAILIDACHIENKRLGFQCITAAGDSQRTQQQHCHAFTRSE